jgi:hypothetical protein
MGQSIAYTKKSRSIDDYAERFYGRVEEIPGPAQGDRRCNILLISPEYDKLCPQFVEMMKELGYYGSRVFATPNKHVMRSAADTGDISAILMYNPKSSARKHWLEDLEYHMVSSRIPMPPSDAKPYLRKNDLYQFMNKHLPLEKRD